MKAFVLTSVVAAVLMVSSGVTMAAESAQTLAGGAGPAMSYGYTPQQLQYYAYSQRYWAYQRRIQVQRKLLSGPAATRAKAGKFRIASVAAPQQIGYFGKNVNGQWALLDTAFNTILVWDANQGGLCDPDTGTLYVKWNVGQQTLADLAGEPLAAINFSNGQVFEYNGVVLDWQTGNVIDAISGAVVGRLDAAARVADLGTGRVIAQVDAAGRIVGVGAGGNIVGVGAGGNLICNSGGCIVAPNAAVLVNSQGAAILGKGAGNLVSSGAAGQ